MMFRKPALMRLANADHIVGAWGRRATARRCKRGKRDKSKRLDLSARWWADLHGGSHRSGGAFMHRSSAATIPFLVARRACSAPRATIRRSMVFDVFQGESEVAADNLYVGRFQLDGLLGSNATSRPPSASIATGCSTLRCAIREPGSTARCRFIVREGSPIGISRCSALAAPPCEWRPSVDDARSHRLTPRPRARGPLHPHPARRRLGAAHEAAADPPPRLQRPTHRRAATPIEMDADSLIGATLGDRYVDRGASSAREAWGACIARVTRCWSKEFAIKVLHPELASSKTLAEPLHR